MKVISNNTIGEYLRDLKFLGMTNSVNDKCLQDVKSVVEEILSKYYRNSESPAMIRYQNEKGDTKEEKNKNAISVVLKNGESIRIRKNTISNKILGVFNTGATPKNYLEPANLPDLIENQKHTLSREFRPILKILKDFNKKTNAKFKGNGDEVLLVDKINWSNTILASLPIEKMSTNFLQLTLLYENEDTHKIVDLGINRLERDMYLSKVSEKKKNT